MDRLRNPFSKAPAQTSSPQERIVRVHAYIAGFLPDLVVGFQKDGNWYLPGGVVEGNPFKANFPHTSQEHFYPLANYVKQQTGLVLTGLSDALQLTISHLPGGPEATIIYVGGASGELTSGQRLDLNNLPLFAVECGDPKAIIEKFRQPAIKSGPSNLGSAEPLEGVFVSEKPTGTAPNGDECYYLLRFYADGLVLQTGVCTPNLQEGWHDIRNWFHRDSLKDLGRGQYHLESGKISFTTVVHFRQMNREVVMDFSGQILRDELVLSLLSRTTGEQGSMSFVRFANAD
jgi:hypothetical protein